MPQGVDDLFKVQILPLGVYFIPTNNLVFGSDNVGD